MANFENLNKSQKIRVALHRDVHAICSETCHFLGLEITKSAMEIIGELVYKKLQLYGIDLEAFAKHAKRAAVNSEDVKLLVRRNPSLKSHLNKKTPTIPQTKEKRRKTVNPKIDTPAKTVPQTISTIEEVTSTKEPTSTVKEVTSTVTEEVEDEFEKMFVDDADDTIDLTKDSQ